MCGFNKSMRITITLNPPADAEVQLFSSLLPPDFVRFVQGGVGGGPSLLRVGVDSTFITAK